MLSGTSSYFVFDVSRVLIRELDNFYDTRLAGVGARTGWESLKAILKGLVAPCLCSAVDNLLSYGDVELSRMAWESVAPAEPRLVHILLLHDVPTAIGAPNKLRWGVVVAEG